MCHKRIFKLQNFLNNLIIICQIQFFDFFSLKFISLNQATYFSNILAQILSTYCNHVNLGDYILMERRRQWQPTPVLLPEKSHGQRSLVGCSPWGQEELDMTERLHFHFSLSCIGEGNGNPLQCSCLENPRNRGAWWAAVYGVA